MYQALYRKYRSKNFDEIVGQDHIKNAIKHQVKNKEVSHAYLFSGTRGTGKTSMAKILSRAVNCLHPVDGNPCNECEVCKSILNGTNLDVVEMDAASNNGVDDIRELKEKVVYPPSQSKYKVYIIDEVHMLSKGAFNALLKVLEEPPEYLIFILATTEPERVPQTILSRTQRYNFVRISIPKIIENLKDILQKENKQIDERVYTIIANAADGSMRDAVSLLDRLVASSPDYISYEDAISILGMTTEDNLFALARGILNRDSDKIIKQVAKLSDEGRDLNVLLDEIITFFRRILIAKEVKDPKEILWVSDLESYLNLASEFSLGFIIEIINSLNTAKEKSKFATNKRIILELYLIELCNGGDSLLSRLENLENKIKFLSSKDLKKVQSANFEAQTENQKKSYDKSYEDYLDSMAEDSFQGQEEDFDEISVPEGMFIEPEENLKEEKNQEEVLTQDGDFDLDKLISLALENNLLIMSINLKEASSCYLDKDRLTIDFMEEKNLQYDLINREDNIKAIEKILKKEFNRDINIKFQLKKNIEKEKAIDKLYDLFGKENIERN